MASYASAQDWLLHAEVSNRGYQGRHGANEVHRSYLEVIAASVVYGPHDKTTPIPIILFQKPEKVLEA
jgi:hypothetical protein